MYVSKYMYYMYVHVHWRVWFKSFTDIQPTVAIDLQTSQSVDSLQSNHHFTITSPELYEYYSSHNLLPVESLAGVGMYV